MSIVNNQYFEIFRNNLIFLFSTRREIKRQNKENIYNKEKEVNKDFLNNHF
jgi:hypothetical protein